jgi:Ni,Fe-hydrogenase I small subunit
MDRSKFHEANWIYKKIQLEEAKKSKLLKIKSKIIDILEGHVEIPEDELFATFAKIEKLAEYLEADIKNAYNNIDKL